MEINKHLNGHLVLVTSVVTFASSFLLGWNLGVLNQPSKLIQAFYNATYNQRHGYVDKNVMYPHNGTNVTYTHNGVDAPVSEYTILVLWSVTTSLIIPGALAGALIAGVVADKLCRKGGILLSYVFITPGVVLSTACVLASCPEMLMVGRILIGIGIGMCNGLTPILLTEITPKALRGAAGMVHQLSISTGVVLASVCGLNNILGTEELWPYLLLVQMIPVAVGCCCFHFIPESPSYLLLTKGDTPEAIKSLQYYRCRNDVGDEIKGMIDDDRNREKSYTIRQFLADKTLIKPLLVACIIPAAGQLNGIGAVVFYSYIIYENAGMAVDMIPYAVIGTLSILIVIGIIVVPLVETCGRRPLLIGTMATIGLSLAVNVAALHFQESYTWLTYVSIVCVLVFVGSFAAGVGPIQFFLVSELFRQGPRPLATACCGIVTWTTMFIVGMVFEPLQYSLGEYTFLVFLGFVIIFLILIIIYVPETKNRSIDDIVNDIQKAHHGKQHNMEVLGEVNNTTPLAVEHE